MKMIIASGNVKVAFNEINQHICDNRDTAKAAKVAEHVMVITREVYELQSQNLPYNQKVEFAMMCYPSSLTQLFEVR